MGLYDILQREGLWESSDPEELELLTLNHKVVSSLSNLRQSSSLQDLSQLSLTKEEYLRVVNNRIFVSKQTKMITALRVVLSMILEKDKDLSWIDIVALYELVLRIEKELMMQDSFVKKYGSTLKVLTDFLIETRFAPQNPERFLGPLRLVLQSLPSQFFIPRRNLSTELLKMRELIFLVEIRPEGTKLKYLPPKAYIGKGYRDKGARRKPEHDASPSWQEVAVSKLPKELKEEFQEYLR